MTTIKKAINKETNEEYKVLIQMTRFDAKKFAMIEKIIAFYDAIDANYEALKAHFEKVERATEDDKARYAKRLYKRKEIYHASVMCDLDNKRACAVYYVTKNKALQTANHLYDLKRCKLQSDDSAKTSAKKDKKTSAKKESAAKLESAQVSDEHALTQAESDKALALLN
jgi:hypothetical protein